MLVPVAPLAPLAASHTDYPFADAALTVVFAAVERTEDVRAGQRVRLADASVISPDDAYLVLPLRARFELLGACARGNVGRVAQWLDEAVVVRAEVDAGPSARLWVGDAWQAHALFERPARTISPLSSKTTLEALNDLPAARTLCPEGLFDADALESMRANDTWLGPTRAHDDDDFDALLTWAWTARRGPAIDVRAVLVAHDEDCFTAMIAPAMLAPHGTHAPTVASAPSVASAAPSNLRRLRIAR